MLKSSLNRRRFLQSAGGASALLIGGVWSERPARASLSPNEKLNIAAVGTGGMAGGDLHNLAHENIVAICDVDDNTLGRASQIYSKAEKYNDFRLMLEKEQPRIDAVMVATPDHVHASASLMAMRMGKHCFCEKPLAWSVEETRIMSALAAEKKLATQMGINVHAQNNYRRVVEVIQSGAIGPVQEVVVWCGKAWGGGKRPQGTFEVPATLKWDLWLGPAPERPFAPGVYHPAQWRRWWDFGCGTLGDMACHLVDLPFWALGLRSPTTIEAEGPPVDSETAPLGMTVRYEFAAKGDHPAIKLTWHDGNRVPKEIAGRKASFMGVMFLGEKGQMYADYGSYKLYPEEQFKGFTPPPQTIPNSVGHWKEWTDACKSGTPTTCNFDYSGALSQTVLLGNVAYRAGKKLEWDGAAGKVTNCPEAAQFLGREYRKGWTL
jgi:predicted dehydrogenase